jgi:hypothetical protein
MLILQDELKLLGCCLGEGTSGSVYTAKYGSEEVAVKTFFLKGATEEELKKVRIMRWCLCLWFLKVSIVSNRLVEGSWMTTSPCHLVHDN